MERPLTTEPLSLDLVNTQWVDAGQTLDLLDEANEARAWMSRHGFVVPEERQQPAIEALRTTRDALLSVLTGDSHEPLNTVLSHGRVRLLTTPDGPGEDVEFDDPAWEPSWHAAANYLELRRERPDRIRKCAHDACVLWFYDTSRNGSRRWCSMDGCGNRAKVSAFYQRQRSGQGS